MLRSIRVTTSLTHRPFALLWTGQTISRLGDSLYRITLAWWVLQKTGSATAMGIVQICTVAPMLIFLLIGGVAVDRFSRVRVMLASDGVRAGIAASVALLAATGALEMWHVYVAAIVFGFVDAFFQPAYVALVPEITPRDVLPSANSLTSLSAQLTGIAGPALGALVVATSGTATAFALNALSFVCSGACLVPLLRLMFAQQASAPSASALRDVRAGLGFVLQTPWLWVTILIFGLSNMTFSGPLIVGLPFLVERVLHADVGTLGLLFGAQAAGQVLAALWFGRFAQLRHRGLLAYGATVFGGLLLAIVGLPVGVAGVALALFLLGATSSLFVLIWTNTLQEIVPRDMLGRVASIDLLGSYALLPVGFAVAGWAIDWIGPQAAFIIGGALTAGLNALGLLHPAIRRLD